MPIVLRITRPVSVMSGGMSVVILMQLGTFLLYLVQDLPRRLLAPKAPGVPGPESYTWLTTHFVFDKPPSPP